jgi:hypothetical protein
LFAWYHHFVLDSPPLKLPFACPECHRPEHWREQNRPAESVRAMKSRPHCSQIAGRRVCGLVAISRALIAKRLVQVGVEPRQRLKRGPARADQLGRWALARSYRASAHGRSIGTVPSGSYDLWARLRRAPVGPLLGSPRRAPARPPSPALAAAHVVDLGGSLRPWRPPPDCRLTNAQIVVTLDERLGGRDARFCGNSICGAAVAPEELGAVT